MATVLAFDREMASEYGITAALLYQELKRKQHYWESQDKLNDGFFWCDQGAIAEWLLVHHNTIGKAAKTLEDAGLIEKKISYKPGTLTPTTWWKVVEKSEIPPKVIACNPSKSDFHIKAENTPSYTTAPAAIAVRMKPSALRQELARIFKAKDPSVKQSNQSVAKLQERIDDDSLIIKAARKMKAQAPIEINGKMWKPDYFWFVNPDKTDVVTKRIIEAVKSELTEEELSPWDKKRYDLAIALGEAKDYDECRENWGQILAKIISTPEYRELENDR